jgi:hypothetical protein
MFVHHDGRMPDVTRLTSGLTALVFATYRMTALDPLQTFITMLAASRVGCEADIHTGLLHVGAHRSRDCAELLWKTPVEPLMCNYSPRRANRRLSQLVEQRLGFF